MRFLRTLLLILPLLILAGCGHKETRVNVPAPPDLPPQPTVIATPSPSAENHDTTITKTPPLAPLWKPLFTQLGLASWYGAPYHNRRGSNGEVYDMNAMTAAHRTLPLNSIVRVTNVKTGRSAVVRITDRGPFIEGRIIDLSQAAAKQIALVQKGTGRVRV